MAEIRTVLQSPICIYLFSFVVCQRDFIPRIIFYDPADFQSVKDGFDSSAETRCDSLSIPQCNALRALAINVAKSHLRECLELFSNATKEEPPECVCLVRAQYDMLCREVHKMIYSLASATIPRPGWE